MRARLIIDIDGDPHRIQAARDLLAMKSGTIGHFLESLHLELVDAHLSDLPEGDQPHA